jgi:outer membrane protein
MCWLSKQILFLHRMSVIAFVDLVLTSSVPGQTVPASPEHPWHGSAELTMQAYTKNATDSRFTIDQSKTYSLAELIDLAQAHNPATRGGFGDCSK